MNKEELASVILDQKEGIAGIVQRPGLIKREFYDYWKRWLDDDLVKVVTGIRRCGKSTFSLQLLRDRDFAYLNFDDERIQNLKTSELNMIVECFYQAYGDFKNILFDEIQNMEKWELFINRLKRDGFNLIITGSNAKLLSKELGTHLTGRYIAVGMLPFSFREYLVLENLEIAARSSYPTREKALLMKKLQEYQEFGGFPEMLGDKNKIRPYLQTLYSTILTKDVIGRYRIKYIRTMKEISNYLVSNSSQMVSYNKIKNVFNLNSVHTAKNYVSYLEDAQLICIVEKFSSKHKEILASSKKIYCIDNGLINAIGFKVSENRGGLLENTVAIELFRRKTKSPLMEIYYWKDYQQHEVDFVIKEGANVTSLIQATYALQENDIRNSEIDSLLRAGKELKCANLLVITWDYEDVQKISNRKIKYLPLWKWLIKPE